MKEFLETVFKSSKERIRNPLMGSFSISWVIFNWNSLLILFFSDSSIEDRIEMVRPKNGFKEPGFWWPLFVAVLYVTAFPYLMHLIDRLTNDSFKKRKKNSSDRRTKELEFSSEVVKAEVKLEKLRTEYKDVSRLNDRVKALEEVNADLKDKLDQSNSRLLDSESMNSDLQIALTEYKVKAENEKNDVPVVFSEAELTRLRNRFLLKTKAVVEKKILEMTSHFYGSREKSASLVSSKFIAMLDELRPEIIEVIEKYSKYEELESRAVYDEIKVLINGLEDNIDENTKRITSTYNSNTFLKEELEEIFAPILDELSPK